MATAEAKKILVVDDYENMRHLCSQILEEVGYRVECACNGRDALTKLGSSGYDLVVTDIDMPELDGISLYSRAVLEDPEMKDNFIFMTGNPSGISLLRAKRLDNICLLKPFNFSELIKGVRSLVSAGSARVAEEEEKRGEERFSPAAGSRVLVEDMQQHDIFTAKASDLSPHGIKVRTQTGQLKEGSSINLCMYFNYLCVVRDARVVWSTNTGDSSVAGLYLPSPLTELPMMTEHLVEYAHHGSP